MKNKKVLFTVNENGKGYKKAIQDMYGNKYGSGYGYNPYSYKLKFTRL